MALFLKSKFLYGEEFELKEGILVIENGVITDFLENQENLSDILTKEDDKIITYEGLVIPSFNNLHTHIGDSAIKDVGINRTLDELVKPPHGLKHRFLNNCSDKDIVNGMIAGMCELYENGTHIFCDYRENGLKGIQLLNNALNLFNVSKGITKNSDSTNNSKNLLEPYVLGRPTIRLENTTKDDIKEDLRNEIFQILDLSQGIGLSGLNEYDDCELKFIRRVIDEYNSHNDNDNGEDNIKDNIKDNSKVKSKKVFSVHAGEHEGSVQYSHKNYGLSEIERLINLELSPNFIIHAVHVSDQEIQQIKENNIPLVVCPRANASFNVGLPKINELHEKGILMAIGTDNFMANSPSIFREMDFIYKLYHLEPLEILKMATVNGNKILGNSDYNYKNTGLIKEGFKPNFSFINYNFENSKNLIATLITRCESKNIDIEFKYKFESLLSKSL
ncbi:cytosine/adenosine deaminase-related metal-dependent hydrolase [Methanococcus voltae]|uniref:Cytosine/adenosine deaminase-related metal-dependent hydrolase n=1 Tax=Methanococcus voltae TaxID=2188 RepID=A0A8J7USW3_METVO|nr:amidohydrolase family protein [Methanococcus voltae]MBP2201008.1 cytosine/adenosine deaminase-related metal-dependent hydrolase [Methanococcus voltae]